MNVDGQHDAAGPRHRFDHVLRRAARDRSVVTPDTMASPMDGATVVIPRGLITGEPGWYDPDPTVVLRRR